MLSHLNCKIIGAKKQGLCFQKFSTAPRTELCTLRVRKAVYMSFDEGAIFLQLLAFVLVGGWPVSRVALKSE